jgi:predicted enzyme related to lactoylglutathione lyase
MSPTKIYTILRANDLAVSEAWYTNLLGRGPDNRPMPTLVQWELFEQAGLGLATDPVISGGKASISLFVDDIAAERRRLEEIGIRLGEDIQGDYSQMAQVEDPAGNRITLSTPPNPPYPPA